VCSNLWSGGDPETDNRRGIPVARRRGERFHRRAVGVRWLSKLKDAVVEDLRFFSAAPPLMHASDKSEAI
jgi:hypothetical protein